MKRASVCAQAACPSHRIKPMSSGAVGSASSGLINQMLSGDSNEDYLLGIVNPYETEA